MEKGRDHVRVGRVWRVRHKQRKFRTIGKVRP